MSVSSRRSSEQPARAAGDNCLSHPDDVQRPFAIHLLHLASGAFQPLDLASGAFQPLDLASGAFQPLDSASNAIRLIGIQPPIGIFHNRSITVREQPWHPSSSIWPGVQGPNVLVTQRPSRVVRQLPIQAGVVGASSGSAVPPDRACYFLDLLLGKADREIMRGDLEEEFTTSILPKYGARRACFWFWTQTVRTIATRNPVCRSIGGLIRFGEWIFRQIGS